VQMRTYHISPAPAVSIPFTHAVSAAPASNTLASCQINGEGEGRGVSEVREGKTQLPTSGIKIQDVVVRGTGITTTHSTPSYLSTVLTSRPAATTPRAMAVRTQRKKSSGGRQPPVLPSSACAACLLASMHISTAACLAVLRGVTASRHLFLPSLLSARFGVCSAQRPCSDSARAGGRPRPPPPPPPRAAAPAPPALADYSHGAHSCTTKGKGSRCYRVGAWYRQASGARRGRPTQLVAARFARTVCIASDESVYTGRTGTYERGHVNYFSLDTCTLGSRCDEKTLSSRCDEKSKRTPHCKTDPAPHTLPMVVDPSNLGRGRHSPSPPPPPPTHRTHLNKQHTGPLAIEALIPGAAAIVEAFNPAFGALMLAKTLFGQSNKWGKMPYTVYPSESVPVFFDQTSAEFGSTRDMI
jgi:hypothetical protein